MRLHEQLALSGAFSCCLCETNHDALHTLQVFGPVLDRSHFRRGYSAISMDQAATATRAAALERARAAAREGVRLLPDILSQRAKAAERRRRLAESMRMGTAMAAALEEADYDARNEISCGICMTYPTASDKVESFSDPTTSDKAESLSDPTASDNAESFSDPTASDKAESVSDPTASDKAESFSAINFKHGLPTVEEVSLYAPDMPTVSSTGVANDKAGPRPTCKGFDGLSSAYLAFFDGASLESSGGSGGRASNNASGAVKRCSDRDIAAPKRKAHKQDKIEKHVA